MTTHDPRGDGLPASRVIELFAETANRLYASEDVDETLLRITSTMVAVIGPCDVASVSLLDGHSIVTRGATDPIAEHIDAIQYETGQGPCLSAASEQTFVHTPDTAHDERWPEFSRRCAQEQGVVSSLSCRLVTRAGNTTTLGALNLYALKRNAYSDDDQMAAVLFASHAGVVVDAAATQAHLRRAIESRDQIGQAKGILMERFKISADEAFAQLRTASQHLNVKLRDLAVRIAETGETPLQ